MVRRRHLFLIIVYLTILLNVHISCLFKLLNNSHFTTADGTKLWGQKATFTGGTHDWEFSEYSFTVPKAVNGILLYALYRDDPAQGTAYFDDLAVAVESPTPCNVNSDCGSNEVCFNQSCGLTSGEYCAADRDCASGLCRSMINGQEMKCGCTSGFHCPPSKSTCNPVSNTCNSVGYSGGDCNTKLLMSL